MAKVDFFTKKINFFKMSQEDRHPAQIMDQKDHNQAKMGLKMFTYEMGITNGRFGQPYNFWLVFGANLHVYHLHMVILNTIQPMTIELI